MTDWNFEGVVDGMTDGVFEGALEGCEVGSVKGVSIVDPMHPPTSRNLSIAFL